jgi:hypothetical protein
VTCHEVVQLVEAIAAGDVEVTPATREHLESCPRCAAELASAYRLDAMLAARPQPGAPSQFVAAVLARVRTERWTSEQRVDRIFNVAIAAALLLVGGSIAALTNVAAVIGAAGWIWNIGSATLAQFARQAAPVIVTYVAAAGVLMSALVMWWWAERRLSL